MKRVVVVAVLVLLVGQNSWAARAKVEPIVNDPYVSALVVDAHSGKVLYSENPDVPVYPASVIKLMDLLVVLDRVARGQNTLDEMVQITPEAARIGGSQVYLDPKEQFTIEELLYALMVQSANDAAVALAIHISGSKDAFVTLMNQKAAELGMKNTHFHSVHGLPPAKGQEPDQSTASDLALLGRALVKRPEALQYTGTRDRGFRNNSFMMRNHNHLLDDFFGCDGLKTGYFQAAGFSVVATAQRDGNRIIAVVMGSKDRKVRDARAAELLSKGFSLLPVKPAVATTDSQPVVAADRTTAPSKSIESAVPSMVVEKAPAQEPGVAMPQVKPAERTAGFTWGTFLFGIIVGFLLAGIVFFFRKRPQPARYLR